MPIILVCFWLIMLAGGVLGVIAGIAERKAVFLILGILFVVESVAELGVVAAAFAGLL